MPQAIASACQALKPGAPIRRTSGSVAPHTMTMPIQSVISWMGCCRLLMRDETADGASNEVLAETGSPAPNELGRLRPHGEQQVENAHLVHERWPRLRVFGIPRVTHVLDLDARRTKGRLIEIVACRRSGHV